MENVDSKEQKIIRYTPEEAKKIIDDVLSELKDKNKIKSVRDEAVLLYNLYKNLHIDPINDIIVYNYIVSKITTSTDVHEQAYSIIIKHMLHMTPMWDNSDLSKFHTKNNNSVILINLLKELEQMITLKDLHNNSINLGVLMISNFNYLIKHKIHDNETKQYYVRKILVYTHILMAESSFDDISVISDFDSLVLNVCESIDNIPKDKEKITQLEEKIVRMEKEIEGLETELQYRPYGEGEIECRDRFYSTAKIIEEQHKY